MTREQAEQLRGLLENQTANMTDEQILEYPDFVEKWQSGKEYVVGKRLEYDGTIYKVLTAHTSQDTWTPPDAPSLFAKVLIPDSNVIPEWEQPESTNPYSKGDKVTHNGKTLRICIKVHENNAFCCGFLYLKGEIIWRLEQDLNGSYFYAEKMKEMRYMRMEQANYIKAIFTAIFAFLSALLGVLAVPVILLVACNLIDYMTGLMASKYRAEDINSYKSIRGIFKKVSMWLLVVVGAIIDEMLLYASTTIGWKSPVAFLIACVVAMWLICNEIISILENIQDMGVKIPAFLQPLVKHIRSQVEEQINTEKIEEKDSEGE